MRDQVQRWLSACIVAGHDTPDGDNSHASFEVEAPTLEALCRAWLALDGAATGRVDMLCAGDAIVIDEIANPLPLNKQRVLIVPTPSTTGGGDG